MRARRQRAYPGSRSRKLPGVYRRFSQSGTSPAHCKPRRNDRIQRANRFSGRWTARRPRHRRPGSGTFTQPLSSAASRAIKPLRANKASLLRRHTAPSDPCHFVLTDCIGAAFAAEKRLTHQPRLANHAPDPATGTSAVRSCLPPQLRSNQKNGIHQVSRRLLQHSSSNSVALFASLLIQAQVPQNRAPDCCLPG